MDLKTFVAAAIKAVMEGGVTQDFTAGQTVDLHFDLAVGVNDQGILGPLANPPTSTAPPRLTFTVHVPVPGSKS